MRAFGIKRSDIHDYYYSGNLLGGSQLNYNYELVAWVGNGDSPLVLFRISCAAKKCGDLQRSIVREIEVRFRAEFGADRVGTR
jgi:hypothetical protein